MDGSEGGGRTLKWVEKHLAVSLESIEDLRLHTLVTHMFMHAGPRHLASNLVPLLVLGPMVASALSPRAFLALYVGGGVAAAAGWCVERVLEIQRNGTSVVSRVSHRPVVVELPGGIAVSLANPFVEDISLAEQRCVGSSGAVYTVMGAAAALFPAQRLLLLTNRGLFLLLMASDLVHVLSRGGSSPVGHSAHLTGGLVGFASGAVVARRAAAAAAARAAAARSPLGRLARRAEAIKRSKR